jgi:hypothetical protein
MEETKLLSFHGKQEIKDAHIARLRRHYELDEIMQGTYWQNGKGCDTGCTFNDSGDKDWDVIDHGLWPKLLGIPEAIGRYRDFIFETLTNVQAKEFPIACSLATPVGVDLEPVRLQVIIWLLADEKFGVATIAPDRDKKFINAVADFYRAKLAGNEVPADRVVEIQKMSDGARGARGAWEHGSMGSMGSMGSKGSKGSMGYSL